MATVNLCVRPEMKDNNGLMPIYMIFQHRGKRFKHFTGLKVPQESWDAKKQEIIEFNGNTEKWNHTLSTQKIKLLNATYHILREHEDADVQEIKEAFYKDLFKGGSEFFEELAEYIEESKKTKKESTVFVYETLIKDLKLFEDAADYHISFNNLNTEFYVQFTGFLEKTLNNTNNTISKKIKALKAFLHYASGKKLVQTSEFENFDTKTVESVKLSLTEEEVQRLYTLNLSLNKELALIRDIFMFGCVTGLKHSDIIKLKVDDVADDKLLIINQYTYIKTRIPMNNYARFILKKYGAEKGYCFPMVQNVYANKHLKTLGKMAGINTPINVSIHKGNQIIEKSKPKYELITTDTARYTYAALSLRAGMRPELLIQVLGQKTVNALLEYNYFSNPMNDFEMLNCWNKIFL
ncbi:site-specific integrase [Solitalea canadensis]|uniref:Site-specific recombinase XerD n=1 Tax=Solitalea canadensis (strain ATCC 29591 / DSM 3403 / JCM 21819 / LMG 8368 / NBRC 15130 / NCIMB 12057 / USAM 9D) TaxID=929556 RepID=H8KL46_SOLCM|nr:site-specific integrase [Solitalea canadensis]AFD09129.1 site-specific recombinase XerD [Solitalea canadensis DSM 3403]